MSIDKYEQIDKQKTAPTQNHQSGVETEMIPVPIYDDESYQGSGKLRGKNALITGDDSRIGRAVAVAYAKEETNVAICLSR